MKNDLHIAEVQKPLYKHDAVKTLCGEEFFVNTIKPLAETDWIPGSKAQSTEPRGICRRCLEVKVFRYLVSDREMIREVD